MISIYSFIISLPITINLNNQVNLLKDKLPSSLNEKTKISRIRIKNDHCLDEIIY